MAPMIGSLLRQLHLVGARSQLVGHCQIIVGICCLPNIVLVDLDVQILGFIMIGGVARAARTIWIQFREAILSSSIAQYVLQVLLCCRLHVDVCDLNFSGLLITRIYVLRPRRQDVVPSLLRQRII